MGVARPRWGIVGGGMLGMTLAHRLQQAGQQVSLFEAAPNIGGLASPWNLGDFVWDRHYHVTLLSDHALRGLLRELDLEHTIEWVQTRTGFYVDGSLHSMSNLREFLTFPALGATDKLRLAATILYASRIKDSRHLERISVSDWLTKLSGRRTFEKLWLPLLRAKLGESYHQASAALIWAIIARMYAARRTGLKKEMFGYVPGGYARILSRFEARLRRSDVHIDCSKPAQRIARLDSGDMTIRFQDGTSERFDRVVVTTPGPVTAEICTDLTSDEKARLRGITYLGIICASLVLRKPLSGYYVTNITDSWVPFTAVIEMSALVSPAHFNGQTLVYLPKYLSPNDGAFSLSDEQIEAQFLGALERMYPSFQRTSVVCFKVSRVRHVLPVSTLNYSNSLPPMITSVPGLLIANSAHIVNGTLNVNETVQLANAAAQRFLALPPHPTVRMAAAM
jgi:protoporphyrinogen oxidase